MKRKREADLAGAEAKRLGYNSDGFGTQGFPWPNEFSDGESVNGPPSDDDDVDDDAGDLPKVVPEAGQLSLPETWLLEMLVC